MPERPSATGRAVLPASSKPCDRRPGRARTRMLESVSGRIVRLWSRAAGLVNSRLLFYPRMFYFAPSGPPKEPAGVQF